jgi:hypothetical protein
MGYRSDVAYTIRFTDDHDTNNEQSFYTFLLEAKANPNCQIALSEVEINHKKQTFTFTADDVKWYDNYPDVISHMALVNLAQDWAEQVRHQTLHCKIGVMFLRIGEEAADIDERYDGDYEHEWLSVSRSINTDW